MTNQIGFRGRTKYLHEDPKRGVCNRCRYVLGEVHPFSGKVYDVSHMHHEVYDEDNPEAHTIELCPVCHGLTRRKEQKKKFRLIRLPGVVYNKIRKAQRVRESYGDVVDRAIDALLEKEEEAGQAKQK